MITAEIHQIFEDIVETIREPLLVLDSDLMIIFASRSFYDFFKVSPEDTMGQLIYDLGNKQWDIPKLRELLETILPQKATFDDYEVEHDFATIGRRTMLLNARQIQRGLGKERIILLAIEDITERKEIEAGLEKTRQELAVIKIAADEVSEYAESIINTVREPLIALDQNLRVVTVSRSFYDFFKVSPEDTVGQLIYDLGNKQWDIPKLRELLETILPQKATFDDYEVEHDFATIGRRTMLLNARQIQRGLSKERIILLAIEDITERKRMEDLITESEERYRRLFETANDGILLLEKSELKIHNANPAITEMLEYSNKELIGKDLKDVGFPDDLGTFEEIMQSLDKDGIIYYEDKLLEKKSGKVLDTDIYMVDRAKLVQCNIRDITERKHTEDVLRANEEHFKVIFNTASIGMAQADPITGKWQRVNQKMCEITGYSNDELLAMRIHEITHPEDRKQDSEYFQNFVSGKSKNYRMEKRYIRKDDTIVWVNVNMTDIRNATGQPVSTIAAIEDITDRKLAEEALRESEERLKNVLEGGQLGFWDWNIETGEVIRNALWAEMLGYTVEQIDLSVKQWSDLQHPDDKAAAKQSIQDHLEGRTSAHKIEYRMRTKNDRYKWILDQGKITRRDPQGKPLRMSGTNTDITERVNLQTQLVQAQKMEAIGTLAGGIAHDFNNILTAVIGYTELAQMRLEADSEIKEDLKKVLAASVRAKDLVDQILSFSRQTQKEQLPVQMRLIVKEALKLIRSSLPVTVDIRQSILSQSLVLSDPTQLHQIVMNLCTNAAHAMREKGGILEVVLTDVELDSAFCSTHAEIQPGAYQNLTVSDTGYGISADIMNQIFDPFFTTKPKNEGTGLGLSVVHGIVKDSGGTITVYSEPDKGTTFNLYFPIIKGRAEEKPEEHTILPTGTERILVVDDEKVIIDISKRILSSLGYTVEARTSSLETLALFKAMPDKFDLLITDMTMPQMTGDKLALELLKIRPDLPVILCTGFSQNITKERAKTMGIKAFLMKPLLKKEMAHTIRKVLDEAKGSTQD